MKWEGVVGWCSLVTPIWSGNLKKRPWNESRKSRTGNVK
jgi:hypothetical protein